MSLPVPVRPLARPFSAALQRALDRPADTVLRDYADLRIAWGRMHDAALRGDEPPLTGLKMIDALATACLARAALGSDTLMVQIADRLEGRPAPRSAEGDIDEASRAEMIAGIEAIVRQLNQRPVLARNGDEAKEVAVAVEATHGDPAR